MYYVFTASLGLCHYLCPQHVKLTHLLSTPFASSVRRFITLPSFGQLMIIRFGLPQYLCPHGPDISFFSHLFLHVRLHFVRHFITVISLVNLLAVRFGLPQYLCLYWLIRITCFSSVLIPTAFLIFAFLILTLFLHTNYKSVFAIYFSPLGMYILARHA